MKKNIGCEKCNNKFTSIKAKKYHQKTSCINSVKEEKITVKDLLLKQEEEMKKMKEEIEILKSPNQSKKSKEYESVYIAYLREFMNNNQYIYIK